MLEIRGTLTLEPVPEGTRMCWQWDLVPRGPMRLLRPLLARVGRRRERAVWSRLAQLLETSEDVDRAR